jgi:hypothetical protein
MTIVLLKKSSRLLLNIFLFLACSLQIPLAISAPNATVLNKDKCLGYELDYKTYPKSIIAQVQADLHQLYQTDPDWKTDATRTGKPLNDGILGPITWSWMQRFCSNFAVDTTGDAAAALPVRATAIATFSRKYRTGADILISKPFAVWAAARITACDLDVKETLAQSPDDQLNLLLQCYQQPPATIEPQAITQQPREPFQLYVLRDNDFEAMAGAVAKITAAEAVIDAIKGEPFPDKLAANTKIVTLLADLPPEESKKIAEQISAGIIQHTIFLIDDQALNVLAQQGISDVLFNELALLREKSFPDQAEFSKVISAAIKKAYLPANQNVSPEIKLDSSAVNSTLANGDVKTVERPIETVTPSIDKLLIQIQISSKKTYFMLSDSAAESMRTQKKPLASVIIKLMKTLKDIEYPTAELLQLAIKNKIFKASGICKLDKSNTVDIQLGNLESAEKSMLLGELKAYFKETENSPAKYCNEDHMQNLGNYFNQELLPILEQFYSEPMPTYTGKPILWDGSRKDCGCVPKESQTMAYGIFPYWKTTDKAQILDFSTFNRVAYFGLTVTDTGQLAQIKNSPGVPSLLTDNSDTAKAFIHEARRYGSKVDWIIEKEFSVSPELADDKNLKIFLDNLKIQLTELVSLPLTNTEARLRPWLTLGLAGKPVNGDGVTIYFKNYPTTSLAKDRFNNFFKELKEKFSQQDKIRNNFHAIKQKTYVNIIVQQSEYLNQESVFGSNNIDFITGVNNYTSKNLSIPEVQDKVGSLVVLILTDPYYAALDEIYAVTNSINRDIVAPLMFIDYSSMDSKFVRKGIEKIDERQKRLEYIHESFGGGGFWPVLEYSGADDGKDYKAVNSYISTHFSPGYSESLWNEVICRYRWLLIAIMNIWLLLALVFVLVVFYIYPHRCKKLPGYIQWVSHPLTVISALLPPIVLWVYLIAVDSLFNMINLSSLLGLVLLSLALNAGINAVKELKEQKPNRNLLQHQKTSALPQRQTFDSADSQNTDDDINVTSDEK